MAQPPVQPGMPKTGGFMQVDHLGDIYGIILGFAAIAGGIVLLSGWAVRRKSAIETSGTNDR